MNTPQRLAKIITLSASLLASCDAVSIHAEGTITATRGIRTALVSVDGAGQGVFLFECNADGKSLYQRDLDCASPEAAVAVMSDWLKET